MLYGFGVDLGGTTVKLAFFDGEGALLHKWEIPTRTENDGENILPDIAASIDTYIKDHGIDKASVAGIGIGVPGPVRADGTVNRCINLGWGVFNIEKALQDLTGLPVKAGNDANVAALGECWKGGGQGCENMIMATLGTGVGGGIVLGGKVIPGSHGAGGEIGHLTMERDETDTCGCGKHGCVEQYCSATGVVRLAKKHLENCDIPSPLRGIENLTCKDIFDAAKEKDVAAQEILEQVYDYLGRFLGDICCVVDPEVIVLGGGVSKAGQMLLDGVRRYYDKYAFHACRETRFALATLGNDAGVYGACKLILDGVR